MDHGAPLGRALGQYHRAVQRLALALCIVAVVCVGVVAAAHWGTHAHLDARIGWLEALADPEVDRASLAHQIQHSPRASEGLRIAAASVENDPDDLLLALRSERLALHERLAGWSLLGLLLSGLVAVLAAVVAGVSVTGARLFQRHSQALAAVGELRDARDAAEAQAIKRQDLLRAMVASGPFGIHAFTTDGRPVLSTSTLAERYGLQVPDMRRRGLDDIRDFPIAQAAGIAAVFERAAAGETIDLPAVQLRVAKAGAEGGEGQLCVAPLLFPVRDKQGGITHVGLLVRDATDQVALSDRVQRAERLAAIGTLASGVAHELNNPLTSLAMDHELLGELVDEGPATLADQRELLNHMASSLHHIQSVTGDLAEISRPDSSRTSWCELAVAVEAAVRAVAPPSLEAVAVQVDMLALPAVQGSAARVEQIFHQILENAVHAVQDAGGQIQVRGRTEGKDTVVVEVQDDGAGMTEEVRARVFEPFYTTHPGRDGTGLGMYLVQVFLEEIGGDAQVRSRPGEGTTVVLRFQTAPELTLPPSLEGLGSASHGVRLLIASTQALEIELRDLIPESSACQRVADPAALAGLDADASSFDVLIWDAATLGPPDRATLPAGLRGRLIQLDGDDSELRRPLQRRAVLDAVEVVIFGGLGLG